MVLYGWLQCSVTCGEGGLETRYVACLIHQTEDDSEQIVSESYCDLAVRPLAERECRLADCPRSRRGKPNVIENESGSELAADWRTGPWSPVSGSLTQL